MKNNEIISIIIPFYNLENYIERCLRSVLSQTYENLEIIIIDDGSTDKSSNIINKYTLKDKRISYYKQTNKGPGSARNFGIEKCNGRFITFIDGDDYIKADMIEKLVLPMINNNADLALCNYKMDNEKLTNQQYSETIYEKIEDIAKVMLKDMWKDRICTFMSFGKIYKTETIKTHNIKFPEDINNAEDLVFSIKYWHHVRKLFYTNKPLYIHTERKDSLSRKNLQLSHVAKGRQLFNNLFIEYFENNNLLDKFPEVKKIKLESKKTLAVDALRKLGIKN